MTAADDLEVTQPTGAPDQKTRVVHWLRTEPGGLTQLQALQHLAVARLAAIVYRLRGDGFTITTELVEMPTRYGPAQVARYHLATAGGGRQRFSLEERAKVAAQPASDPARHRPDFAKMRDSIGLPPPPPEPMRCGCGHEFDGSLVGAFGCANCNGDEGPAETIQDQCPPLVYSDHA